MGVLYFMFNISWHCFWVPQNHRRVVSTGSVEKLIRIVSHVRVFVEHARRGESFKIDLIIREAELVRCYLKHKFQQVEKDVDFIISGISLIFNDNW